MLWGLEALRVFDDKLKQALLKIQEGKDSMEHALARVSHIERTSYVDILKDFQGAELRHKDMKRDCETILEEFTKRFSRLENAHSSIRERIEQSTRLREGVS